MPKEKRFCPNCGSDWVEPETANRAEQFFAGGNLNRWQCKNCDYTGIMPEGEPEDIDEEIKFEPGEDYSREYTGFGPAYVKYLMYVTLPVLALYYIYLRIG